MDKIVKLPTGKKRTHGGFSFLVSGKLPEHRRYVEAYLRAARSGLTHDLGGEERMSTAQMILVNHITSKIAVLRCIEEHIRETGIMEGHELQPSLRNSYLAYSNSLRRDLETLGIKRKVEDALDIQAYIKEKYGGEAEGKASEGSQGNQVNEGEKDDPGATEREGQGK